MNRHRVSSWSISLIMQQALARWPTHIPTCTAKCKAYKSHHSHSPWATLACTFSNWLQNPFFCEQVRQWHSPRPLPVIPHPHPVPSATNTLLPSNVSSAVLYPISSLHLQCRPEKQRRTHWSRSIFRCCTHLNCGTVCPSLWESITWRKPLSKT